MTLYKCLLTSLSFREVLPLVAVPLLIRWALQDETYQCHVGLALPPKMNVFPPGGQGLRLVWVTVTGVSMGYLDAELKAPEPIACTSGPNDRSPFSTRAIYLIGGCPSPPSIRNCFHDGSASTATLNSLKCTCAYLPKRCVFAFIFWCKHRITGMDALQANKQEHQGRSMGEYKHEGRVTNFFFDAQVP